MASFLVAFVAAVTLTAVFLHRRKRAATISLSRGIDISHWQQNVDWNAVAASGITFAYIKATESDTVVDPEFVRNWDGAAKVNVKRGAYHFFDPLKSVAQQAQKFIDLLDRHGFGELPPALDVENPDRWTTVPKEQRVEMVLQWLEAVAQASGKIPLIYLSPAFASAVLSSDPQLARFPLWLAHYTVGRPKVPQPWSTWAFWQHTNRGQCPGIAGLVDLDRQSG